MNNRTTRALSSILFALALSLPAGAQTPAPPDPKSVPVVDGGIGSCSYDFTVTDTANAPVYAARIKVHIAYGFMYARKLDLEVGTNIDGKARFTGLPERTKRGLFFEASEGDRTANAFVDPAATCKSQFTVVLRKKP
jgi:hypothetical protein